MCISGILVCWNYGFALTARNLFQTPKRYPKTLAPPYGSSLRLGFPSLRRCSGGRHKGPSLAPCGLLGILASLPPAQRLHSASWKRGLAVIRQSIHTKSRRQIKISEQTYSQPTGGSLKPAPPALSEPELTIQYDNTQPLTLRPVAPLAPGESDPALCLSAGSGNSAQAQPAEP